MDSPPLPDSDTNNRLVVVTGLSGSGKSVALNALEDLGFYCIDNIPTSLLQILAKELSEKKQPEYAKLALGIDVRNHTNSELELADLKNFLAGAGIQCDIVFLDTEDSVLIRRFSETRRRHPLTDEKNTLQDAISVERQLLNPLRENADLSLDTTHTNVHQLRELVQSRVESREIGSLSLIVESFGFKHGTPKNADFLFDSRCLPNPHWQPELRQLTGLDEAVEKFLQAEPLVEKMINQINAFLEDWIPVFRKQGHSYLTVAIGCTGGQHRSVYLVERIGAFFSQRGEKVIMQHRELFH
jgi:UPF0042 nucleotide-binding protein